MTKEDEPSFKPVIPDDVSVELEKAKDVMIAFAQNSEIDEKVKAQRSFKIFQLNMNFDVYMQRYSRAVAKSETEEILGKYKLGMLGELAKIHEIIAGNEIDLEVPFLSWASFEPLVKEMFNADLKGFPVPPEVLNKFVTDFSTLINAKIVKQRWHNMDSYKHGDTYGEVLPNNVSILGFPIGGTMLEFPDGLWLWLSAAEEVNYEFSDKSNFEKSNITVNFQRPTYVHFTEFAFLGVNSAQFSESHIKMVIETVANLITNLGSMKYRVHIIGNHLLDRIKEKWDSIN